MKKPERSTQSETIQKLGEKFQALGCTFYIGWFYEINEDEITCYVKNYENASNVIAILEEMSINYSTYPESIVFLI